MILNKLGKDLTDYQWKIETPETQADTFIEWCFEQKVTGLSQGNTILNEWRSRKDNYKSYIGMTVLDFQHYSRHDDTHSVNILNAIELLLGRDRVIELSASDLWILLEIAYCHDLGMALSYEQLKELWESSEFHTYLRKALVENDIDVKNASNYYHQMDNLLSHKTQLASLSYEDEIDFSDEWPVEMQRNTMVLTAAFIRRNHHTKSREFIKRLAKKDKDNGRDSVIEDRMTNIIAVISELHGKEFDDIINDLQYQDQGFDVDYIHPRFAAAMLRLGDLLDLRNNRFNIRALEHFGNLPILSEYHMKKHKAISHFKISPQTIEAFATSDDFEVCRVTGEWFQCLKEEVENVICDWNRLVPIKLKGCILQRCNLKVFFGDTEFDTKLQSSFEVDKKRLNLLMVGSNIYDSPLDCIREYVQNAIDASKMKLWLDISNEKRLKDEEEELKRLTPFNIEKKIYDALAIEIKVSVNIKRQTIRLRIIDHGIGMETECVNGISVVGRSWKQRRIYQDEVSRMPDWLRPTGGFGIGLQSGFMLTEHITIITRAQQEALGYEIQLESPKKSGSIFKIRKEVYKSGTTIEFDIPVREFYKLIDNIEELSLDTHKELEIHFQNQYKDGFRKFDNQEYVCDFLRYYVQKIIPDPIFPIFISGEDGMIYEYRSPYTLEQKGFDCEDADFLLNDTCMCWVEDDLTVRLWDTEDHIFVCVKTWPHVIPKFNKKRAELINNFCYKNIKVGSGGDKEHKFEYHNFFAMCIDIMGMKMEDVLSIRRNAFAQGFDIEEKYRKYASLYVEAVYRYVKNLDGKKSSKYLLSKKINVFLYLLLAIQLLEREKITDILECFQDKILNPEYVLIRRIENGEVKTRSIETKEAFETLRTIFEKKGTLSNDILFVVTDQNIDESQIDMISINASESGQYDDLPEELNIVRKLSKELKENTLIHYNLEICHALLKMGKRLPRYYFRIREDIAEKKGDLVYVMISGLNEDWDYKPQILMKNSTFLQRAFRIHGKRYVAENIDCGNYNELKVDRLPALYSENRDSERKNTYLVSPIGYNVYMNILMYMNILDSDVQDIPLDEKIVMRRFMSKTTFIQMVTENENRSEYEFVVSWVYQYQLTDIHNKLGKEDIDEKYKEMLAEIYENNFKKK